MVQPAVNIGKIYSHPIFGDFKVTGYKNTHNVTITFKETGNTITRRWLDIKRGKVKDTLQPSCYGVGIVGNDPVSKNGRKYKSYDVWIDMLRRCYCNRYHLKHPTYKSCEVCEEWQYYLNFKRWFDDNYVEGYHLDKDIKVEGNKLYSPETCMFVTKTENTMQAVKYKMYSIDLISPEGEVVTVTNQNKFCRDNNLNIGCLGRVINKTRKHHRGWRLYKKHD